MIIRLVGLMHTGVEPGVGCCNGDLVAPQRPKHRLATTLPRITLRQGPRLLIHDSHSAATLALVPRVESAGICFGAGFVVVDVRRASLHELSQVRQVPCRLPVHFFPLSARLDVKGKHCSVCEFSTLLKRQSRNGRQQPLLCCVYIQRSDKRWSKWG